MSEPQAGLFATGSNSHAYLEFTLLADSGGLEAVKAIGSLELLQDTANGLNVVVGIRPSIWGQIAPNDLPLDVHDFLDPVVGPDGFTMPATQRDLFFWIAGSSISLVFDASVAVIDQLESTSRLEEELRGWSYRENRDLIGFIDGSANPTPLEAPDVALMPNGSPGENGSVLLFQKWKHELKAFEKLPVESQEKVVGRTKETSEEFEESDLPINSHVARTTLVEHGEELPIFRRNTAWGSPTDNGTVFVGFSKDQTRLHKMLERMSGIPDGTRDALTHYSTPLSGSYYFVPSLNALRTASNALDS